MLSSDDPVRVFQQFAKLDLLSGGRAEIMAGRGSFTEWSGTHRAGLVDQPVYPRPVQGRCRCRWPSADEYFYLLEGELRFQIIDGVQTARTGSLLSIPAGTVHGFAVASETARVLNLYTPGGFTEQISYMGTPARSCGCPRRRTDRGERRPAERLPDLVGRTEHTQRWLRPGEGEDLLVDERDPFQP